VFFSDMRIFSSPVFYFQQVDGFVPQFSSLLPPHRGRGLRKATRCHPDPAVAGEGSAFVDQASGFLSPYLLPSDFQFLILTPSLALAPRFTAVLPIAKNPSLIV